MSLGVLHGSVLHTRNLFCVARLLAEIRSLSLTAPHLCRTWGMLGSDERPGWPPETYAGCIWSRVRVAPSVPRGFATAVLRARAFPTSVLVDRGAMPSGAPARAHLRPLYRDAVTCGKSQMDCLARVKLPESPETSPPRPSPGARQSIPPPAGRHGVSAAGCLSSVCRLAPTGHPSQPCPTCRARRSRAWGTAPIASTG